MEHPVPIVNVGLTGTQYRKFHKKSSYNLSSILNFLLRAGNCGMKEPGATVAGSESAKLLHPSLIFFSSRFWAIKAIYVIITVICCVSLYFKLSLLGNLALCGTITNLCAAERRICKVKSDRYWTRAKLQYLRCKPSKLCEKERST